MTLALHQMRYDQLEFWRDRQAVFGTVALPLIFLFLLTSIFGNHHGGIHDVKLSTYYVPGIVALGIVSSGLMGLPISLVLRRERGVLQRVRSTPMPASAYLAARALTAATVTAVVVVVVVAVGRIVYGVHVPTHTLPGLVLAVVVGTACCCALGFAFTALIRSDGAVGPITQLVVLPLNFISGVFIPNDSIPAGLRHVADVFPIKHLVLATFKAFDPRTTGAGIAWGDLLVLALWGVAGLIVAVRWFRWSPVETAQAFTRRSRSL